MNCSFISQSMLGLLHIGPSCTLCTVWVSCGKLEKYLTKLFKSHQTLNGWINPWTVESFTILKYLLQSIFWKKLKNPPTLSACWSLPDYSLEITIVFPSLSFSYYCPYDILRQPDFVNQIEYYTFSFSGRLRKLQLGRGEGSGGKGWGERIPTRLRLL